jgi:hypothetical protein
MTTTVVALYEDLTAAQRATQDLVDQGGFNRQNISIAASDASGEYRRYSGDEQQPSEYAIIPVTAAQQRQAMPPEPIVLLKTRRLGRRGLDFC